jgi:hypothetical protein
MLALMDFTDISDALEAVGALRERGSRARFGLAEALAGHGPFDEAIGAYRAAQNLFLALGP